MAALAEARRLADVAHSRLVELGATVGVAESLTGGLVSALLTDSPGTSVTFRGGLVVYATDLKHTLAGVRRGDLERLGPIDATVAEQLAEGARDRLGADYGLGLTGVAGPGGQHDSDVGEVHVAVAGPAATTSVAHDFDGTRDDIRVASAAAGLGLLVDVLDRVTRDDGA